MSLLKGKIALVTGATRGIGRAIALKLAAEGAHIAFTYLNSAEKAKSLETELAAFGVQTKAYASDAANFDDAHQLVTEILNDFGRIDILVNNAGITRDGLMMRMSESQWDDVLCNNLKSAFNFIHACTPVMLKQKSGAIINMSSVVGVNGNGGQCNYSASKAGLIGLTKSIAKELGSRGIRANAVAPGYIQTDMTENLSDDLKEGMLKSIALRRPGTPDDIANTVLFLASDLSSYITGQVIVCDGGMS
ncbi:MAG: 3-oxoacyl-[acyl-carrier-protein] reductase [Bacteroidales bacterium]